MGNCGVGFAPARPDEREWLIELMEGVEDIPGAALHDGHPLELGDASPSTSTRSSGLPRALDVGAHVPHGALRRLRDGRGGGANEPATPERHRGDGRHRRARPSTPARSGVSTSRTILHRAIDGELACPAPSPPTDELIGIGRALAGTGTPACSRWRQDMLDPVSEIAWMTEVSTQVRSAR